jgi:hypothetical protein
MIFGRFSLLVISTIAVNASSALAYPGQNAPRDITVDVGAFGGNVVLRGVETDSYNWTKNSCLKYVRTNLNWEPNTKGNLSVEVQFSGQLLHVRNTCNKVIKLRVIGAVVEKN